MFQTLADATDRSTTTVALPLSLAPKVSRLGYSFIIGSVAATSFGRIAQWAMAAAARTPEVVRVFWAVQPVSAVAGGIAALHALPGLPFPLPESDGLPGVADAEVTTRLDVTAYRSAVLAAMRAHRTQITVWTAGRHQAFALSEGVARPMLDTEHLTLVRGPAEGAHDDLFGGLPGPAVPGPVITG